MSAGRFFVDPLLLRDPAEVTLPPAIANQVRSVLRLRAGAAITLLDGAGQAFTVELTRVDREAVHGVVVAQHAVLTEPRARVMLHLGLLKASKFEWVIQKGTELGVAGFTPLITARTTDGLEDRSPAKLARWHTIAAEAAEQCDRGQLPTIAPPTRFVDAIRSFSAAACVLLAWEDHQDDRRQRVAQVVQSFGRTATAEYHILIGPEGGFTAAEVTLASAAGARLVTLGPRTLRAETAALVLATLTLEALGELG